MCARYAETSTYEDRDKNRGRDSEEERLAKYKHHACSIMAKYSHTGMRTHTGHGGQDHSHLSSLSFTQLNSKVHTIPQTEGLPEKRSGVKVAVNRLNGRSWKPAALSHDWAVFGFEQKHVMLR